MAMHPLMGIIASPLWGHWADRSGYRRGVLCLMACGAACGYFLVPYASSYGKLILCLAFLSAFTAPAMAIASSVSFAVLGDDGAARFGRVRVWGTISYLIMIVIFPLLLSQAGGDASVIGSTLGLELIFPVAAIMCAGSAIVLLGVPASKAVSVRAKRADLLVLLRQPSYQRLLVMAFLAFGLLTSPHCAFSGFSCRTRWDN